MRWFPLLLLALAPDLALAWPPDGLQVTRAPSTQQRPQIATDARAGAFVTWIDYRASLPLGLGVEVYLQHVTALGRVATGWPADGLLVAGGPGHQNGSVFPDGSGGALLLYLDTSAGDDDLYLQRITAAGAVAPGWPAGGVAVGVGPRDQFDAELVGDGEGGAFVSWQDGLQLDDSRARYSHILGTGAVAPSWPGNGRLFEPTALQVGRPLLLPATGGGFLACWTASDDPGFVSVRVLAQKFTADGTADPAWPASGVTVCEQRSFPFNRLASDGAGGFYVLLDDYRNSQPLDPFAERDLYLQHVRFNGTVAPDWPVDGLPVSVLAGVDVTGYLAEDGRGGVYVTWQDSRAGFPQIFGLHLGADGQRHAGWPAEGLRLSSRNTFQVDMALAWDGSDGVYVAWTELTALGDHSYVKRLRPDGAAALGWPADGTPVASTGGNQQEPAVLEDGSGGVIVAWGGSGDFSDTGLDIYAQRFTTDGVVAAKVSLVSAEATPGEVRVRWHVSGETRASVERREGEGEWQVRAQLEADGGGYMTYEDQDLTPGASYSYRLAFASGARGGETSVQVPASLSLALEGARPNPASGALWLAFTLPEATPARLELYDLAGRQVASRDVGALGAGRHVVRLDDGALAPGLYWAALTQGARTLRTRVAMVR